MSSDLARVAGGVQAIRRMPHASAGEAGSEGARPRHLARSDRVFATPEDLIVMKLGRR